MPPGQGSIRGIAMNVPERLFLGMALAGWMAALALFVFAI